MPADKDYYAILHIDSTADLAAIKRAYRKLALMHHPDKNLSKKEDAAALFKDISEAYEILSDETKRKDYDANTSPHEIYFNEAPEFKEDEAYPLEFETLTKSAIQLATTEDKKKFIEQLTHIKSSFHYYEIEDLMNNIFDRITESPSLRKTALTIFFDALNEKDMLTMILDNYTYQSQHVPLLDNERHHLMQVLQLQQNFLVVDDEDDSREVACRMDILAKLKVATSTHLLETEVLINFFKGFDRTLQHQKWCLTDSQFFYAALDFYTRMCLAEKLSDPLLFAKHYKVFESNLSRFNIRDLLKFGELTHIARAHHHLETKHAPQDIALKIVGKLGSDIDQDFKNDFDSFYQKITKTLIMADAEGFNQLGYRVLTFLKDKKWGLTGIKPASVDLQIKILESAQAGFILSHTAISMLLDISKKASAGCKPLTRSSDAHSYFIHSQSLAALKKTIHAPTLFAKRQIHQHPNSVKVSPEQAVTVHSLKRSSRQ